MNLQPIAAYFLPDGWSIGYSGNVLANWKNRAGSDFTVPIGIGVSKVHKLGKLPVKFGLGVQWMAVQPDRYGQKWNVQLDRHPGAPEAHPGKPQRTLEPRVRPRPLTARRPGGTHEA